VEQGECRGSGSPGTKKKRTKTGQGGRKTKLLPFRTTALGEVEKKETVPETAGKKDGVAEVQALEGQRVEKGHHLPAG